MKRFSLYLSLFFILAVCIGLSEAGVVITTVQESYGSSEGAYTSTAFISNTSMRMETNMNDQNQIVIYRNDRKVFWIINPEEKSYTELTKKDIRAIKGRMDQAMMQLQEQMKNMPPEQRAMMEQMMKGRAAPMKPKKTVYRKTGTGVKVNKWKCDTYEGFREGSRTNEVCTTGWRRLGLEQEQYDVIKGMGDFTSEFTKGVSSFFRAGSDEWEKEQGYPGVPVRTITYSMGKAQHKTEIREVRNERVDESLFDLPPGLRKQQISGLQ
jgi:hypothetical protein